MMNTKSICPSCKRVLQRPNAWHYCKEVAIDDIFLNKPDEVLLAFDKLLQIVADWDDVEISATKNCVVFVRNKTFIVAKPMTKFLEVKFYSDDIIEDDSLYKCQQWNSKYEAIIRLRNENEFRPHYLHYIRTSYSIS